MNTVETEDYKKATATCANVWTACIVNLNNSSDEKLDQFYADYILCPFV